MLIRQSLNFAAHFAAGLGVGALIVAALARQCRRRDGDDMELDAVPPRPTAPEAGTPPRGPQP